MPTIAAHRRRTDIDQCGAVAEMVRNAGVWVDAATIETHLARQETMRTAVRSRGGRCAKAVEEMLRAARDAAGKRGGSGPAPDGR